MADTRIHWLFVKKNLFHDTIYEQIPKYTDTGNICIKSRWLCSFNFFTRIERTHMWNSTIYQKTEKVEPQGVPIPPHSQRKPSGEVVGWNCEPWKSILDSSFKITPQHWNSTCANKVGGCGKTIPMEVFWYKHRSLLVSGWVVPNWDAPPHSSSMFDQCGKKWPFHSQNICPRAWTTHFDVDWTDENKRPKI